MSRQRCEKDEKNSSLVSPFDKKLFFFFLRQEGLEWGNRKAADHRRGSQKQRKVPCRLVRMQCTESLLTLFRTDRIAQCEQ